MSSSEESKLPNVLVLGGTGFIARHFVRYLRANKLCGKIRVADKVLPVMAYLDDTFKADYESDQVEFKQSNLTNESHLKRVFADETWDYVVNLAAETKFGLEEDVYKQYIYKLSTICAKYAAQVGCKRFIEVSTAQVYDTGNKPRKEGAKIKPFTKLSIQKRLVEEELEKMDNLDYVILRPAMVYGQGDINGLAPRIIVAASYVKSKDKMKLLWSGDMKVNTVHVEDVARAIWHVLINAEKGAIYNLADSGNTSQKTLNLIFEKIFKIKTGFHGNLISKAAALKLTAVAKMANDNHMSPWSEMCKDYKIGNTPLSPYLDKELLYNKPLCINGTAITGLNGFKYLHPALTEEGVREELDYWIKLGKFPDIFKEE